MPFQVSWIFNIIDFIVGAIFFVYGCLSFAGTFQGIFIPFYICLFSLATIIFVFKQPNDIKIMIPFYFNLLGRGITYIFYGCLCLGSRLEYQVFAGIFILVIAVSYIILWILNKFNILQCISPSGILDTDTNNNNDSNNKSINNDDSPQQNPYNNE
mmetsp:Transcript_89153/g.109096  ORF Transcript_89153/g.109096 Transcript_89153/m.109096 type:complete len:156 (+) Transcript_89153:85-552(+)